MRPEEFCSYKLSMRLKARGFNEECDYYYTDNGLLSHVSNKNELLSGDLCSAPIYQKALRWLRRKYKISAEPRFTSSGRWQACATSLEKGGQEFFIGTHQTFEEAVEHGINNVLDKQIF